MSSRPSPRAATRRQRKKSKVGQRLERDTPNLLAANLSSPSVPLPPIVSSYEQSIGPSTARTQCKVTSGATVKEDRAWQAVDHTGAIRAVALSPDGTQLASASTDKTVRLWDATTGTLQHVLVGHKDRVIAVAFSPDGTQLGSASGDTTVRLWDVATGSLQQTLRRHTHGIRAVIFSPDGTQLASASKDKTVRFWDVATGTLQHTLSLYREWVNVVSFSLDGTQLVLASGNGTVRLYNAATGALHRELRGHSSKVTAAIFSPDGTQLASASCDRTVRLWDTATGKLQQTLVGDENRVSGVAFSPDSKQLLSASINATVRQWTAATGTLQKTFEGHRDPVTAIAFSPDGTQLASAPNGKTIRIQRLGLARRSSGGSSQLSNENTKMTQAYTNVGKMYMCGRKGCEKAFNTLSQLNKHATMQKHGTKKALGYFAEIRDEKSYLTSASQELRESVPSKKENYGSKLLSSHGGLQSETEKASSDMRGVLELNLTFANYSEPKCDLSSGLDLELRTSDFVIRSLEPATVQVSSLPTQKIEREFNSGDKFPKAKSMTDSGEYSSTGDGEDPSCSGTSEISTTGESEIYESQMDKKKQDVLDRLMEYFYSMFDTSTSRIRSCTGSGSRSERADLGMSHGVSQQSTRAPGERRASDGDPPSQEGDGGDGSDERLPQDEASFDGKFDFKKKLACPYFKRDPRKYQNVRSCPGPGFVGIHRVKEHLYRRHELPLQCLRCYQQFKTTTNLKDHQRTLEGCEVRDETPAEGFDQEQKKKLQSRKRSAPDQSETDKWREIYIILFPNDDRSKIPTPYYEYDSSREHTIAHSPGSAKFAQYQEYLGRELPRYVRRCLRDAIDKKWEPIEEDLKAQLVEIVKTGQEELFRNYQMSISPESSKDPVTMMISENVGSTSTAPDRQVPRPSTLVNSYDLSEDLALFATPPYSNNELLRAPDLHAPTPLHQTENPEQSDSGYISLTSEAQLIPTNFDLNCLDVVNWDSFDFTLKSPFTAITDDPILDIDGVGHTNIPDATAPDELRCNCKGKGKAGSGEHRCIASNREDA